MSEWPFDVAQVDEVLSTTRAVRRRLDLERPVDSQLLLDCIDVAEQAPTGGNLPSRRWIIVRDPGVRSEIADLYRRTALGWMSEAADRLAGTGDRNEKVMSSAVHLAEHLAEVPALVVVTIMGSHDGSGRPGLFDSVIQAAWSFCLAARARGLGTTWMTAALSDKAAFEELLHIPEGMTEIVVFPVAHTKGTVFKRAERLPARSITYLDHFGTTVEAGDFETLRFDDGPGAAAEIDIDVSRRRLWPNVSDITVPARFSEEFTGAEWTGEERGLGATFVGRNRHPALGEWSVPCWVDVYDEPSSFGWVTSDPANPGARWRFDLESRPGGTRLRFTYRIGPGPSGVTRVMADHPDRESRILRRRIDEVHANMVRTVRGLKALAESAG